MIELEKGRISNRQLIFLIGGFIQGSIFCAAFVFQVGTNDVWISTMTAFAIYALFAMVIFGLSKKFPGKNLIQINDIAFGPYIGKAISSLYIIFFILTAAANVRLVVDQIGNAFFIETPVIVLAILGVAICAYAIRGGIETIGRMGIIFFVVVSTILILMLVLSLSKFEINNFLPVLDESFIDYVHENHVIFSIYYGETFLFLMIIPYVNNLKKVRKSVIAGLSIGSVTLLIVSIMITGLLGNLSSIIATPLISVIRQIEIGQFISRLEFLVVSILLFSVFVKVSIIFYASALGTSQLFKLRSYKPIVIPIGILIASLVMPMFDDPIAQAECGVNSWPFFAMIFEILLPVITLLVVMVRKLPKKQGGQ